MSTTLDEIKIDLDAIDAESAKKADKRSKKADTQPVNADAEVIQPEKTVVSPEIGLEKLKKQLDDERQLRIAAENRARELSESEARAKNETQGSQLDLVKNTIASLNGANDALEAKLADLQATGDFAGAAKVQREMGKNEAKILRLEEGKTSLENAPKATPRIASDPVEDLAVQLTPRSAAWVRSHPEYARSPAKYAEMLAAHNLVTARGTKSDTDAYFSAIERVLDIQEPTLNARDSSGDTHVDIDPMAEAAKPIRSAAPAGAPVSRSGNGAGERKNVVKLSSEEVEMASMMGQTPEEYARAKLALKAEGKLN